MSPFERRQGDQRTEKILYTCPDPKQPFSTFMSLSIIRHKSKTHVVYIIRTDHTLSTLTSPQKHMRYYMLVCSNPFEGTKIKKIYIIDSDYRLREHKKLIKHKKK